MGINERKTKEKEKRRAAIVKAAEKVFFTKGIDEASMNDVAKKAELAKGTLYLYFPSKDDLCMAITSNGLKILGQYFKNEVSASATGLENIKNIGKAYFKFCTEQPNYAYMMNVAENVKISLDEPPSENVMSCMIQGDETMQLFIKIIQGGIDDGSVRKGVDPKKTAFLLWSSATGLIQMLAKRGVTIELQHNLKAEELTNYYFDFVETALKSN